MQATQVTVDRELRKLAADSVLFAVLDACDESRVLEKVHELGEERAVCLYRGTKDAEMLAIAPYLVRADAALLEWLVQNLWEEPWGIFAVAQTDLTTLRRHLRTFLTVQHPDGPAMYFRYYDPRVLPTFLKTCNEAQLKEMFGPVRAYGVSQPGSRAATLLLQ